MLTPFGTIDGLQLLLMKGKLCFNGVGVQYFASHSG